MLYPGRYVSFVGRVKAFPLGIYGGLELWGPGHVHGPLWDIFPVVVPTYTPTSSGHVFVPTFHVLANTDFYLCFSFEPFCINLK